MSIEIDQSGKLEQLNTHTVIACANQKQLALLINAASKRKLTQTIRKSIVPRQDASAILFGIKEKIIKETIVKLIEKTRVNWQGTFSFKQIGKRSPAHRLAWKVHRNRRSTEVIKITEKDILKWWQ